MTEKYRGIYLCVPGEYGHTFSTQNKRAAAVQQGGHGSALGLPVALRVGAQVGVPAALLSPHIPANAHGKATEDGPRASWLEG